MQDKVQTLTRKLNEYESINNQLISKNTELEREVQMIDKENLNHKDVNHEMDRNILTLQHNLTHER